LTFIGYSQPVPAIPNSSLGDCFACLAHKAIVNDKRPQGRFAQRNRNV